MTGCSVVSQAGDHLERKVLDPSPSPLPPSKQPTVAQSERAREPRVRATEWRPAQGVSRAAQAHRHGISITCCARVHESRVCTCFSLPRARKVPVKSLPFICLCPTCSVNNSKLFISVLNFLIEKKDQFGRDNVRR